MEATGLSLYVLNKYLKAGTIQRQSSRLKSLPTDGDKFACISLCRSHVDRDVCRPELDVGRRSRRILGLAKVYLTAGEVAVRRACKSKLYILKVTFLAAVTLPRFDHVRDDIPAVVESLNVSADVYQDYVLHKDITAIKTKFPSFIKRVDLQHDNVTPHASINYVVLEAASIDGWKFVVYRQPPNSPDVNVLDLSFFDSIQAHQYNIVNYSVDDVIHSTLLAFDMLSVEKLENVFLSLQAVMRFVLEHCGDNHFKLPHRNKDALRRAWSFMMNLSCTVSLLDQEDMESH
ncbi:Aste57867_2178 [Aphanomyces stellatus]|uniref:Aste57867_2178 protein n=1 Tax=Aphanomyces stellatus TaxID=120398 RepID=A0A485K7M5_9STRA|nr:hypothetical protein As57867_002173 [Aphanomyces stellatus]VFT79381.1 Aste57867_2178 [Aphanomyces stellatus]